MEIYVRYASRGVSQDDLVRAFSPFGEVRLATIVKHDATGEPIGIGVVRMSTEEQANIALSNLGDIKVDGAPLILDEFRSGVGRRTGMERRVGARPPLDRRTSDRRDMARVGLHVA